MKEVKLTEAPSAIIKEVPQRIRVDKIVTDPNQPRKTFNKHKDAELLQAVSEHGIFQSLLLRPHEDKFMIVCGERRFTAALKANLPSVPAIVRVLTDQEAQIIQHIENIQRVDVNVMEQARGFKVILQDPTMTDEIIAKKIGKSVSYVRQNIKLNDLTEEWQHLVYLLAISVSMALQIAQLPDSAQKALYKDTVPKGEQNKQEPIVHINSNLIAKYQGFLSEACFDLTDARLVEKVGACTGCRFNSATLSLFLTDAQNPRCSNVGCFRQKQETHLQNQIAIAKNDPSLLITYQAFRTQDLAEKLKAEGLPVLSCRDGEDCHEITSPTKPLEEPFMQQAKKEKLSKTEATKRFKEAVENYNGKVAFIEKRIAQGIYKKALMLDSQYGVPSGHYVIVAMNEKTAKKAKKVDVKNENVTAADIQGEMDRIESNYQRSLELDQIHIQEAIVEAYKAFDGRKALPKKLLKVDTAITNFLLLEMLSYDNKKDVKQAIKIPQLWQEKDLPAFYKALISLSPTQISFIVRQVLEDKHINSLPTSKAGYLVRQLTEQMACFPIKNIETAQAEKTTKRTDNKNKRIAALKTQKSALAQKQTKVAVKKGSNAKGKVEQLPVRKKTA